MVNAGMGIFSRKHFGCLGLRVLEAYPLSMS